MTPLSPEIVAAVTRYSEILEVAFEQQLKKTGAYTKDGMQLALSRAQRLATLEYIREQEQP